MEVKEEDMETEDKEVKFFWSRSQPFGHVHLDPAGLTSSAHFPTLGSFPTTELIRTGRSHRPVSAKQASSGGGESILGHDSGPPYSKRHMETWTV